MIRRELMGRLVDLENRYAEAVSAKRDEPLTRTICAYLHAVEVAAVAVLGEPKIDEPLHHASSRMRSKVDKEFATASDKYLLGEHKEFYRQDPHFIWFEELPGANARIKFERIFSEAPAWLLKFTAVEWDAEILKFR